MEICIWAEDDCGCHEAQCNKKGFSFNEGGPESNGFKFCPYCGKSLVEIAYSEEGEDAI